MKKLLLCFCLFVFCASAFVQKAEAQIEVGLLCQQIPEMFYFVKYFGGHLLRASRAMNRQEKCRILIMGWKSKSGPYAEIFLWCSGDWIPLCETEESDFKSSKALAEAAKWMGFYTIFYSQAMNKSLNWGVNVQPKEPWKKHRRRR